ncbi:hypothetical protein TRVA0_037S01024 [Trichomonascus vanleenenianus]|uniref:uncharacterized protein n=1 Tax=Trichomonascus vanleenenianus TaxID=2268995 RepID=UPI003ECB21BC
MDVQTVSASVASSLVSEVTFYPLQTLLTLRVTSAEKGFKFSFLRYYRGLTTAITMTTPAFATYLVCYKQLKRSLAPYLGADSIATYLVSGGLAEMCSSVLWTPMEVVQGRLMLIRSTKIERASKVIRQVYATEGLRGFYRGYLMGVAVYLPGSAIWWGVYEEAKKRLGMPPGPWQYACSSGLATIVASSLCNLLSVVKTRQQLAAANEIQSLRPDDHRSIVRVARNLIRENGWLRAWTKGLHIHLLHAVPSSILGMIILEVLLEEEDSVALQADLELS